MSYYRDTYLKSEHWRGLRVVKLAQKNAMCCICNVQSWNNDVHHVVYRKLWDVQPSDLRVLCRDCHKLVHKVLEENQSIQDAELCKSRWRKTLKQVMRKRREQRQKFDKRLRKQRNEIFYRLRAWPMATFKEWKMFVLDNPNFTEQQVKAFAMS